MVEEKTFCTLVKEQIVDEKHAGNFYDHLVKVFVESITVPSLLTAETAKTWAQDKSDQRKTLLQVQDYRHLFKSQETAELTKALIEKLSTDEKSHLKILEVIDRVLCT